MHELLLLPQYAYCPCLLYIGSHKGMYVLECLLANSRANTNMLVKEWINEMCFNLLSLLTVFDNSKVKRIQA